MAKVSVGTLSSFNHEAQEWSVYKDRLEQWFLANDLVETGEQGDKAGTKRRAILLSSLSESTYKLVRDLALPQKVGVLNYDKIIELLDGHFQTKKCGFAERSNFFGATQQSNESMAQWAARVRGLAGDCEFSATMLDELLRDRFVLGMSLGPERDMLFTKDLSGLTLSKALGIAESMRSARLGAQQSSPHVRAEAHEPLQVLKMSPAAQAAPRGRAPPARGPAPHESHERPGSGCSVCGYTGHRFEVCRFRGHKCKVCGVKGHLKRMCPKRVVRQHFVECSADDDEDDGKRLIANIRTYCGEPMTESVVVNKNKLNFEIDTGSAVTVISERTYGDYFSSLKLQPSKILLQSYNGGRIDTLGTLSLPFVYKGKQRNITAYIVRGNGPLLLGRDFIAKFNLQISTINLCKDESQEITSNYPLLFSDNLGCCKDVTIHLKLKDGSKPIFCRARPLPFALRDNVERELNRLVELGILVPVQYSEYASPIVPVLKRDKSIRICADYAVSINKQLLVEKYPLPRIEELFAKLRGGQQFSKLDLSRAYNQFQLSDDSQLLTCINTHKGLYKYTRLVFGLASAPAIFQRTMETILAGLDGVLVYLDDILITGKTKEEHRKKLHEVFRRLQCAGLVVQKEKCSFFQNSVSYLGFTIDKNGIHKDRTKVKAIIEAKVPTNSTELKSFLGLVNYYRSFVKNASSILNPLHELLKKNCHWVWKPEHDNAVKQIKEQLASEQNLAHFNPDAQLVLTVDASPSGLGAILSQIENGTEKPVSYASRSLSAAEKRYSQIQKEATAIIFGIRKFHQYLYGRAEPFVLKTDHKPLLSIFNPNKGIPEISANRLQRYAIFLSAYNYIIQYVSSAHNTADFLSRSTSGEPVQMGSHTVRDDAAYINFVCEGERFLSMSEISDATGTDSVLMQVMTYVRDGWPAKVNEAVINKYFECRYELAVENNCVMRGHRLIVPSKYRNRIVDELHKGHLGIKKMKAEARDRFWWPGMSAQIDQCVSACSVCNALRPAPPRAPLAPWPYPPTSWYRVHIDLAGPINNKTFLVIVDAYSKWVECFDVSNGYSTRTIIERLCEVMARFGLFKTICSDNGTYFVSAEFEEFCLRNNIEHITSPTYSPASNGQAESYVKIIKKAIKSILLTSSNNKDLNLKLLEFLFNYRNSKHTTTDKSPAELIFGHKLRSRLDSLFPKSTPADAALDNNVKRKQFSQCKQYNGKRTVQFDVGELVLVRIIVNQKPQWTRGCIEERLGCTVYLVRLLNFSRIVKKHTNQLLKFRGEEDYELADTGPASPSATVETMPPVLLSYSPGHPVAPEVTQITTETPTPPEATTAQQSSSSGGTSPNDNETEWVECDSEPEQAAPTETRPDATTITVSPSPQLPTTPADARSKRPRRPVNYKPFF